MQRSQLQNRRAQRHQNTNAHLAAEQSLLVQDKSQALQQLIKVTKSLLDLGEKEAQALAQDDMLSFAILQDEKTKLAEHYAKMSEEFRDRLPQFRGVSPALLDRLEYLQIQLGEVSQRNADIVRNMYDRARANTQTTLLNAQEMGQDKRIKFANNNEQSDEVENG